MQHIFALVCMAAAQSVAAAAWDKHASYNCGNGYGASDLDDPVKGFGNSSITVEECEAACTGLARCTGVKFLTANGGNACYRQSDIVLSQCKTGDSHWTMFLRPLVWEKHSTYNCGNGYGARDLDDPVKGFGNSSITVEECEAACTGLAGCAGVKFLTANGGNACYRQSDIVLSQCKMGDAHWTMFLRPVVWVEHSMYNCGAGYGARDLDDPVKGFGTSSITVEECEAACTGLAGCTGIKFLTANGGSACYRQSDIVLAQCKTGDAHWTMFLRPVVWEEHSTYNCGAGYGARDLDDPVTGFGNSSITVQECETACTGLAGCTGVKFLTANGGSACYRQSDIVLSQCKTGDAHWTMFLKHTSFGFGQQLVILI